MELDDPGFGGCLGNIDQRKWSMLFMTKPPSGDGPDGGLAVAQTGIGYALAGVLLTFISLLVTATMAMVVSMTLFVQAVSLGIAAVFGVLALISAATLTLVLEEHRRDAPRRPLNPHHVHRLRLAEHGGKGR